MRRSFPSFASSLLPLFGVALLLSACGGGGTVDDDAGPGADAAVICDTDETLCGSTCSDTDADPANCGACGNACAADEACSAGACVLECGAGATACDGACVDTDLDPANCGACGEACPSGEVCSGGSCALTCVGGTTRCGDRCVDTDRDAENCGGCDVACGADEVCSAGACGISCVAGSTLCDSACVDTTVDPANCGGCGVACASGEVCSAGSCGLSCSGGATMCGSSCVDTTNDPSHCGACGVACASGEFCASGSCAPLCPAPRTDCGGACVDMQSDPSHCGACGMACGAAEYCAMGSCTSTCPAPLTDCSGTCSNTDYDPANCGGCGVACAMGNVCVSGACRPLGGVGPARYLYLANWAAFNTQFDVYDVGANTWSSGASLPVASRGQLASDGATVWMLGTDNDIYEYDVATDVWTRRMAGPGGITSYAFFQWLNGNFYLCQQSTSTLHIYSGGAWSTRSLSSTCSIAGGTDPVANEVYVKRYGQAGFWVVDASTNAIVRTITDGTSIAENTSSGAVLGGTFYTRSGGGQIFALDGTSGARTATGDDPGGSYPGFSTDHASRVIYMHSSSGFSSYDPSTGVFTPLATGPTQSTVGTITQTF